jgi:hypothetical protein
VRVVSSALVKGAHSIQAASLNLVRGSIVLKQHNLPYTYIGRARGFSMTVWNRLRGSPRRTMALLILALFCDRSQILTESNCYYTV